MLVEESLAQIFHRPVRARSKWPHSVWRWVVDFWSASAGSVTLKSTLTGPLGIFEHEAATICRRTQVATEESEPTDVIYPLVGLKSVI